MPLSVVNHVFPLVATVAVSIRACGVYYVVICAHCSRFAANPAVPALRRVVALVYYLSPSVEYGDFIGLYRLEYYSKLVVDTIAVWCEGVRYVEQ